MVQYIKNQKGTTLLELMVAISLFVVVMLMATTIFQFVMEGQQGAIAGQNTQESMRYFLEMMSREVRTALGEHEGTPCYQENPDGNPGGRYKIYNTSESEHDNEGNELYFQNKDGECVTYKLDSGRVVVSRKEQDGTVIYEGDVTPDEIVVSDLLFYVVDDAVDAFHSVQPLITIRLDAEAAVGKEKHRNQMSIQTSVSSRYYDGS